MHFIAKPLAFAILVGVHKKHVSDPLPIFTFNKFHSQDQDRYCLIFGETIKGYIMNSLFVFAQGSRPYQYLSTPEIDARGFHQLLCIRKMLRAPNRDLQSVVLPLRLV